MFETDLMFHWFIYAKLGVSLIAVYAVYKLYKGGTTLNVWWIVTPVLLSVHLFNPVKMDVGTQAQTSRVNATIAYTKKLPAKVVDDSFSINARNVSGISKEDME